MPENIARVNNFLEKLAPMAEDKRATLAQLVLRWTISQPGITIALAGARNARQAVENAKAVHVKISQEEMDYINKEIQLLDKIQA
jgi:Predicted oxidoreductases (related to aryl-alcohol dehydrogenases)